MAASTFVECGVRRKERKGEEEIIKTDEIKRFKHKRIQNTNII